MAEQNAGAAPAQPVAELPNIPTTWPGGFGVYKYSKKAVLRNGNTIGLLIVISIVFGIGVGMIKAPAGDLLSTIISIVLEVALITAYIASVRGNKISLGDSFSKLSPMMFLKMFLVYILTGLILIASLIALIVPFFFVLPRVLLAPYYLVDKNLGIIESIKASWNETKGHASKIWGIIGVSIGIVMLSITIIGIPFAIYFYFMYLAAMAVAYEYINKNPAAQPVAAPAVEAPAASAPTPAPTEPTPPAAA